MTIEEAISSLRIFLSKDSPETPIRLFLAVSFAVYVLSSLTDEQKQLANDVWNATKAIPAIH